MDDTNDFRIFAYDHIDFKIKILRLLRFIEILLMVELLLRSLGLPYKARFVERTKPLTKTKKSEELLEEYKKKRGSSFNSQCTETGSYNITGQIQ